MRMNYLFRLLSLGLFLLVTCNHQLTFAQDKEKSTIIYAYYNGEATDDGNITGKNTNEEFHLFTRNDTGNIIYVISKANFETWSSKKIMPDKLYPGLKTYKIDIAMSIKLKNDDETVEFYEITKLNSLKESDEIDD